MELTNKFGWPAEICRAISKDRYSDETEAPSDYSATTIIAPIQKTIIERNYPDRLKVFDYADKFWAFLGSVAHSVLEEQWHEETGTKCEERLYSTILGKTISGKIDCYANGEIRDYKSTKSYKIVKADYSEWAKQLKFNNCNEKVFRCEKCGRFHLIK